MLKLEFQLTIAITPGRKQRACVVHAISTWKKGTRQIHSRFNRSFNKYNQLNWQILNKHNRLNWYYKITPDGDQISYQSLIHFCLHKMCQ